MKYKELFRIVIEHPYFQPGEPVELAIVPSKSTLRFLTGQRFIIKDMVNGIKVLVPVNEAGSVLPALQPDDLFTFKVFPTSNIFHLITDVPDLEEGEILRFSNAGLSENDTQLASSVAEAERNGVYNGFPVVADAAIQVSDLLLDNDNVPKTPQYRVVFNPRSEKWKYYFVSDPETTDLSIQDLNGQLTFNRVDAETEASDKIASSLRSNFPNAGLFLFESDAPIASRSQGIKKLQLLRNLDVIINHLPNPDVEDVNFKIIKIHQ